MGSKLIIVDGNSIINRAFYGIRPLSNRENIPTNAVFGFLNILLKHIDEQQPDHLCVAFDVHAPTFRHKQFAEYKAHRKPMPDDLRPQIPLLKEVLGAMNICVLEKPGYEADDIIGTVAAICETNGTECIIITGDKDDLQLAAKQTKVFLTITAKGVTTTDTYDADAVIAKYGVTPNEFIDVKALMGDTSDNIPGVAGIGEKTALALIAQNKSIENIYNDIENCGAKGAALQKLKDGRDMAFLSKELATIDTQVPLEFSVSDALYLPPDNAALFDIFTRLEFKSFIKKLGLSSDESATDGATVSSVDILHGKTYECIDSADALTALAERIAQAGAVTYRIYMQGTPINHSGQITGAAFTLGKYAAFVPIGFQIGVSAFMSVVGNIFADENVKKTGHDVKADIVYLSKYGIEFAGLAFDTAIGAYILDPSRSSYPLADLSLEMLDIPLASNISLGNAEISMDDLDGSADTAPACSEVFAIDVLKDYICARLKENEQEYLYYNVELPLIHVLADMQIYGMAVDRAKLEQFNKELSERVNALTAQIHDIVGYEFNVNSTKQLGEALFVTLELPVVKKTKTGFSTDAEVLEKLNGKHEIIELLVEYRLVSKIKSTYGDGLLAVINQQTGRIHSSFNQTVTVTGRISSTEPNMQNIPVRHELGREIRKMFIADGDFCLVDADYSQIELRVLASISGDGVMKQAFLDDIDIHTVTASQVLGIPLEEVTSAQRSDAKAVNFGIVYGIGEYSLSQDLGIPMGEAKRYISEYLEHYSGVRAYMADIKESAAKDGYVSTLLGRRRYIPEIRSSNFQTRAFGERVALNTPIQGSAADIIKLAMVRVSQRLKAEGLRSRLILQVHDELIVETHKDELETVCLLLRYEMEHALTLDIPLVADTKYGKSWYDAK